MFIENTDCLEKEKFFICNRKIANKLATLYKIPILSILNDKYYFALTEALYTALSNLSLGLEGETDEQ